MNTEDAAAVLEQTRSIQQQARASMHAMWFPLVLFGTLTLTAASVSATYGGEALAPFWLVAGPVGTIATGVFYWRWENRIGLEAPALPSALAVALIVIGCFGTGLLGGVLDLPTLSAAGPPLAISVSYLVFARLCRSLILAGTAIGLAALDIILVVAGASADTMASVLSAAYGAAFLGIGLAELVRGRPAR